MAKRRAQLDRSISSEVQEYMDGVMAGTIVAGRLVRAAVRRHIEDLEHGHERGLEFSPYYATRAIQFFRVLKHTTGEYAGERFEPRGWQKFILWVLFGWRRRDGTRRFRWAYISVARGNGKSPLAAAIANYLFIADEPPEPRSQVYAFATKEAQARDIVFEEAKKQIEQVPAFDGMIERLRSNMNIIVAPWNGSKFEPKGGDSKKSDGWILHGGVIDELHEWHANQRKLFEKIETSMAKRRQPLVTIITTAGDDDSEIWQEQYDFYSMVVDRSNSVESDSHFAYIAEIDADAECPKCEGVGCQYCDLVGRIPVDPLDEDYWPQANPMLAEPRSPVKIDELRSMAAKARIMPSALNTFRRYYANQRVASFFKLITPEMWAKGAGELPDLTDHACYAGFDWGWKDDLAALALVFPLDGKYYIRCWAWIPRDGKRDLLQEPWATWIRNGIVTATDGDTTDINAVYTVTKQIIEQYELKSMAADPSNCREYLTRCVNEWGITTYEFYQSTKKYNEPTRGFVDLLNKGRICHGNNPLLAWCANNLTVKEDSSEYIMPAKSKSADKIDPIVATIMGLSECLFDESEPAWTDEDHGF